MTSKLFLILLFTCSIAFGDTAFLLQSGASRFWCPLCGSDIQKHLSTSYVAKFINGTTRQYDGIECLIKDMDEYGVSKDSIMAYTLDEKRYLHVKNLFFILTPKRKRVVGLQKIFAFKNKQKALLFAQKNRGEVMDFETAINTARTNMKLYNSYHQKIKNKRLYPMGKKIFTKLCNKDIDLEQFLEINELMAYLKKQSFCKKLDKLHLKALAIWLWDRKRDDMFEQSDEIHINKDEKCPICGMFVYKYPRWAAQIFYDNKHYSFDGAKDMMKFYFGHKEGITKIILRDYYSQKVIDATKAFYVIGSDVYGPMGNELIPFKSKDDAKNFMFDHRGQKIVSFDEITQEEVYKLDE